MSQAISAALWNTFGLREQTFQNTTNGVGFDDDYRTVCVACAQLISCGFSCSECHDKKLCCVCYERSETTDIKRHYYGRFDVEEEIAQLRSIIPLLDRKSSVVQYMSNLHQDCRRCGRVLQVPNADTYSNPSYYYTCREWEEFAICLGCLPQEAAMPIHRGHTFDVIIDASDQSQANYCAHLFLESKDSCNVIVALFAARIYLRTLETTWNISAHRSPEDHEAKLAMKLVELLGCLADCYLIPDTIDYIVTTLTKMVCLARRSNDIALKVASLVALGEGYLLQFELTALESDAFAAIEILKLVPMSYPRSTLDCRVLSYMAGAHLARWMVSGSDDDLKEALSRSREAVACSKMTSETCSQHILIIHVRVLMMKFYTSREKPIIDEAIQYATSTSIRVRGDAYLARFRAFGDVNDLKLAVELQGTNLALVSQDPKPFSSWLAATSTPYESNCSLAEAYLLEYEFSQSDSGYTRFMFGNTKGSPKSDSSFEIPTSRHNAASNARSLDDIIKLVKIIVDTSSLRRSELPLLMNRLCEALLSVYDIQPNCRLLDYAIGLQRQVLQQTSQKSPHRLQRLRVLGRAFLRRHQSKNGRPTSQVKSDGVQARRLLSEALELARSIQDHSMVENLRAEIDSLA
ncbi:hypothetical protein RhiJN_15098 [Ceratobasidium sp. AG-Ba]|nr:hypothetical protein RhiJN_15098 [Ceratobasidium sp. AG-Ba]